MTATAGNRRALSIFSSPKSKLKSDRTSQHDTWLADLLQISRPIGLRSISPQDDAKAFDIDQSRPKTRRGAIA
jgi:hypothetical protein